MLAIITFIIVFGILVTVHEFGHFYMAKKSGVLVREFSIGMGPKLFFFRKNGTTYTLRILPLGGYVRMAGSQDDDDEIKPGTMATIKLSEDNIIQQINLSNKNQDINSIPVQIVKSDLEDKLFLTVFENGNEEDEITYNVNHDATIVEEDGTELLIAPKDVQFQSASLGKRALINIAGPFNNVVLSIVAYFIVALMLGGITDISSNEVGIVQPHSVAYDAGIKTKDKILKIDDKKIKNFTDVQKIINQKKTGKISLELSRKNKIKKINLVPKEVKQDGRKIKLIGIGPKVDKSIGAKIKYAFVKPFSIAMLIFGVLGHMITGGFDINQFSGPVGIYSLTSQVASQGMITIISFMGMLSINLGIMNLIPIPALDGGKLLLNLIEGIRGKPISEEKENIITLIGVALLFLLFIAVTWNDIQRFFIK